jgi:cytochrome c oxidase assembly factor CtaG
MRPHIDTTSQLLLYAWEIHPTVVIGCLALLAWYFLARPRSPLHAVLFCTGVLILLLSLISPIDPLGDQYLFTAHMLQHLLLILAVPPFLIAGLTVQRVAGWLSRPAVCQAEQFLGNPAVAWLSNIAMMLAWHLPVFYNAANASTAVHVAEHLCFLVTGCMFWWPIFTPVREERMQPGPAMLYLFAAAAVSTVLGVVLTFLPAGSYEPYLHPDDEIGALRLIRVGWGISAAEDQKLAGLLMWVPGCSVYFVIMLMELARWFRTPDADKRALLATLRTPQQEVHHG